MDRSEHDGVFRSGVELDKNLVPVHFERLNQIDLVEKLIDKYTLEFGEEAVIAYWVQPYGGPVMYVKAHPRRMADIVHEAYDRDELSAICPELGIYRSKKWCAKMRELIQDPNKRVPIEKIYSKESIDFLSKFYLGEPSEVQQSDGRVPNLLR